MEPCISRKKQTNVWILNIGKKKPTPVQQILEAISGHKLAIKFNKLHFITARRETGIIRTNLQENRCILNKIRNI